MDWSAADAYCTSQGGKLPLINDGFFWDGENLAFIDGFGPEYGSWPVGLPTDYYWTGTTDPDYPDLSWVVGYGAGYGISYIGACYAVQHRTYRVACIP